MLDCFWGIAKDFELRYYVYCVVPGGMWWLMFGPRDY